MMRVATLSILAAIVTCVIAVAYQTNTEVLPLLAWSIAQWLPIDQHRKALHNYAWHRWHDAHRPSVTAMPIATVDVQKTRDISEYLITTYGSDWRQRPLLLRGLWNESALRDDRRKLSIAGLMREMELEIPYFTDARSAQALTPDAVAPVGEIVANITRGMPHKIGSQLVVQRYPELLQEVVPAALMTQLFGDHFDSKYLLGNTYLLPGTTTVPLFVANGELSTTVASSSSSTTASHDDKDDDQECHARPTTGLHSEPIANVAVQLSGSKEWLLIEPQHSFLLRPALAPDGRAFFPSFQRDVSHVPRYHVVTHAGDAVWVPTWTWHKVDYNRDLSLAASVFHFRSLDFVRRNPVFAVLIVPAMIKELLGLSTQ